jgi:UPF0755 protein
MNRPWRLAGTLLAVAAGMFAAAIASLRIPYQGFQGETFVRFDRGARTPAMARALKQAGVIRYQWQFWLERTLHSSATLEAGEYRYFEPASTAAVFQRIARGDVFFIELTIPEGGNRFDIARLVQATGLVSGEEFLRLAADPSLVRDLDTQAMTLEGYLFPASYRVNHSTTAEELCETMVARFRREWTELTVTGSPSRAEALTRSPSRAEGEGELHSAVTLASMVEKETGVAEERPVIAGVFLNRLGRGMKLDCDPTAIYAALLENHYDGTLHRSDLESLNPYNTYRHAGLPPGPIANPGADALRAALHPAQTNYLYFVANSPGPGHQFSTTLAAHQKAVKIYRHGSRKGA